MRKIFADMENWFTEWKAIHQSRYDEDSVLMRLLEVDLAHAELWTVCAALRGCQWDKVSFETDDSRLCQLRPDQKELAFHAKDAAMKCIQIYLHSHNFRSHLKYATHDQLATVAFAAVFLLKIAMLYPNAISLPTLSSRVSEIVHVLSVECYAERYALTLKLMLANYRRKTGAVSTVPGTPRGLNSMSDTLPHYPASGSEAVGEFEGGLQSLLSLPQIGEGLGEGVSTETWPLFGDSIDGFAWPNEFSPSNLPTWLQDNVSSSTTFCANAFRASRIWDFLSMDPIHYSCRSSAYQNISQRQKLTRKTCQHVPSIWNRSKRNHISVRVARLCRCRGRSMVDGVYGSRSISMKYIWLPGMRPSVV